MGRWGGRLIASLQYFINCGMAITNMILTGQLLQSIYMTLCAGEACRCRMRMLLRPKIGRAHV